MGPTLKRLGRLARDRRGGVLVEAALVLPLLFSVVFGSIELGRILWTKMAMDYAVQEAARCADIRPDLCGNAGQVLAYAQAKARPLDLPAGSISVSYPACGVQVTASITYQPTIGSYIFTRSPAIGSYVCRPLQPS